MAFASSFRRVLGGLSSTPPVLHSQLTALRHNSTLVTPKLFISGLSRLTTDERLTEAFSPFGQLVEAKVIVDRVSGKSKGFGFVKYTTIEEAEKARQDMNAKFLDGWVIFVDPAKPREPRPPPPPPQSQSESSESGFRINKTIGWCG
ncbi:hypothetical protein Sjap_008990 [Stephania japonica]|uniref:RRM domain-containing protein n=1 Tax=Stephania japonica TaxID=461633 RepID=A0AAP0JQK8_9MAGN